MYKHPIVISWLLAIIFILSSPDALSKSFTKIGPSDGLLTFEVRGEWKANTKVKGKILKFTATNSDDQLVLIYYEDRAFPYDPAKALDKFLNKYKFKYLPDESLITKTVQGKEMKVNILFALGEGFYKGKRQRIFARSSLIDNTNVILIMLTPPDKYEKNCSEMKRLLKFE